MHGPTDRPRPTKDPELHLRLERHLLRGRRIKNSVRAIERVSSLLFIITLPHRP